MNLYDKFINSSLDILKNYQFKELQITPNSWEEAGEQNLILRSDMAYELGGGDYEAVSGFGITSNGSLVNKDQILLYGPDLQEIKEDSSYARITILKVAEDSLGQGDAAYNAIRKIEYTRYHVNPKGFMMRISAASEREPVRISKDAIKKGIDFAKIGSMFISKYHEHKVVEAVKIIYITLQDFPYKNLEKEVMMTDKITESLNKIFQDLILDCSICKLKPVCDQVEGMKELHFSQAKGEK